jgi:hypothetical protein
MNTGAGSTDLATSRSNPIQVAGHMAALVDGPPGAVAFTHEPFLLLQETWTIGTTANQHTATGTTTQSTPREPLGDRTMNPTSLKSWKPLLPWILAIGGLAPGLAVAATPAQTFYIHGQVQVLEGQAPFATPPGGRLRLTTPVIGTMSVDPGFTDPSFGPVGRVTSITVGFPLLSGVPAFNTILTQGPEISGITPLKYDVTLLNAKGQQVQIQFTTLRSPATYPGFGTPMGSLVDFSGGSFMQGSNSGPLDIGYGGQPVFLQNFRGRITALQSRR